MSPPSIGSHGNCLASEFGKRTKGDVIANLKACEELLREWGFNDYGWGAGILSEGREDWGNPGDLEEISANAKSGGYRFASICYYPVNAYPPPLPEHIISLGFKPPVS